MRHYGNRMPPVITKLDYANKEYYPALAFDIEVFRMR